MSDYSDEILEYTTIIGETTSTYHSPLLLDERVNELIKLGYQPFGSPYIYFEQCCQAMVKVSRNTSGK